MAHTALSAAFYLRHTAIDKGAMNKFRICFLWRNEYFKSRMPRMLLAPVGNGVINSLRYFFGNGAMNATQCWQLRNDTFGWHLVATLIKPPFLFLSAPIHLVGLGTS
jgi:hypothetical protein